MKIMKVKNLISFLTALGIVFASVFSVAPTLYAGNCNYDADQEPIIVTTAPTNLEEDSATLNAYYSSGDACYTDMNRPYVTFEFGDTSSMDIQSEPISQMLGSHAVSIEIDDLEPDETYYYRAVLYDGSRIVKGSKFKFRTKSEKTYSGPTIIESDDIVDVTETRASDVFNNTTTRTTQTSSQGGLFGGVLATNTNAQNSAPSVQVSDIDLSIDNDQDVLTPGQFITYEVTYENISRTKELEDAVLIITLPRQVKFESTSDGSYVNNKGGVLVNLRDMRPGTSDTVEVIGRVRTAGADTQAIAEAEITYRDTSARARERVTDVDIDEVEQTQSVLAAGLFTGNFVPGSVLGWLIVGALLIAIIYLIRLHMWQFYWRKDRPGKPKHVQEHMIGQAPRA